MGPRGKRGGCALNQRNGRGGWLRIGDGLLINQSVLERKSQACECTGETPELRTVATEWLLLCKAVERAQAPD